MWLEYIKRNSNFTQMIMITPKVHSTIKWLLKCPPRASTMALSRRETLTTYHRERLYDEWFCTHIHHYMGMCQQKLQAGLDICDGLTAQKYIAEIVRPNFELHFVNHALADSNVLMRGGTKPPTTRISQDVPANVTSLLLTAKNPGSHVCLSSIIYTVESLRQTKFTRKQVNI